MPSLRRHLRLAVLLAVLLSAAPAALPALAQTFAVTLVGDVDDNVAGGCGPDGCTLREAIRLANASPGADTITFNIPGAGPHIISPASPLPAISDDGTTIDGTNLATGSEHTIVLRGDLLSLPGKTGHGLVLISSNNEVRDMVIGGFLASDTDFTSGSAILIDGTFGRGDNNRLYNNWLGLDANGTSALNNARYGVRIGGDADNNIVGGTGANQRNVIAGGGVGNVGVGGAGETGANDGNRIVGNYIGTNVAGNARPTGVNTDRTQAGINIDTGASGTLITDNLIGGMAPGAAANAEIAGIFVAGFGTSFDSARIPTGTVLQRNLIGVTSTGAAIPNRVGLIIGGGANYGPYNTTVGDPANPAGGRNVVSGNLVRGIEVADTAFKFGDVTIAGNYVGLSPAGTPLPNGVNGQSNGEGIYVGRYDAADAGPNGRVTIGPGNVISANITFGVRFRSGGHTVRGNFLGTNATGASSTLHVLTPSFIANTANGAASIWIENGDGITIGGSTAADRNVIAFSGSTSGRVGAGVLIDPDASDVVGGNCGTPPTPCSTGGHTVRGNYIGVRAAGDAALNSDVALQFQRELIRVFRSNGNTISENVISGGGVGISLGGVIASVPYPSSNNVVSDNKIGTRASGLTAFNTGIRNQQDGVRILAGTGNRIERNLIAFNGDSTIGGVQEFHGILVSGVGAPANDNDIIANRLVRNGDSGGGNGIHVDTATAITISRSETSTNAGNGIALRNGGNGGRAAPIISAVSAGTPPTATGSTNGCDGCTVELFTSSIVEVDEGPVFLASGTATGGSFSIAVPGCQRYLTATVTDAAGNTSPFSAVFDAGAVAACTAPLTLTLSAASPANRNVAPGTSTIYNHTLTHNAQVQRSYTLQLTSTLSWASGPTIVTLPAAPAGGSASVDFGVTVSVPVGTVNGTQDVTTLRAVLGSTTSSAQQTDTTTAQVVAQTPAAPAVSPAQAKPFAPGTVTFTHIVTNTGDLAGVFEVVSPQLVGAPAGFSLASAMLAQTNIPGRGTTTLTIVVNTPATPPAPGSIIVRFKVGVVSGQQTGQVDDLITVAAVRSFTFTPDAPQTKATPAGSDVFFDYLLTNTGNGADNFTVVAATTGGGNPLTLVGVTATPSLTNLAAGAVSNVRVTFRAPSGTAAASYGVSVTAQGTGGVNPPTAVTRTATVTVTGGGSATILPGAGTPDPVDVLLFTRTVTFTNIVTNTGNAAVPITVPGSFTAPAGWSATTTATTCNTTVAAGATCSFTVVVSVPVGADAGSYDITVSATADNSGQAGPPPSVTATAINRVNVLRVRGVVLAPDLSITGAPSQVLTFTHTLTNTGNGTDSFTLGLAASTPGWNVIVTPTLALNVTRGLTRTVTVTARIPNVISAGTTNIITVTATAQGGAESDSAVDTATVASITAADLSPGTRKNVDAGQSATFTHIVTNTGTTTTAFSVEVQDSSAGWSSLVTGSPTAPLVPGGTATVSLQVTSPISATIGVTNTTTLRLFEDGTSAPLLDDEADITTVGPAFGVLLSPDNIGAAVPESTAVFTHTLTNIGTTQGLFSLTAGEANGWATTVTPNLVNLGAGQSLVVEVRVLLPNGLRANTSGFARVRAELVGDPTVNDDATDSISVLLVAGVDLSASQVRVVQAGPPQSLSGLSVYNSGNDLDTFDLVATGVPAGWTVTLTPSTVQIDKDSRFRVAVEVIVPANLPRDIIGRISVEARSRTNSSVRDSVELTLVYPGPVVRRTYYLPLLAR